MCGDGKCEAGETCSACSQDCGACPPVCGDGKCEAGETCSACSQDCGACPPVCGDGTCDTAEDCSSCSSDCGACAPVCGDGQCTGYETTLTCHKDCAPNWLNSASPDFHGRTFMKDTSACKACHGSDLTGGVKSCDTCHSGWKNNCTFCHGGMDNQTGAPPMGVDGETLTSQRQVGAHSIHVSQTEKKPAFDCATCHATPADALSTNHIDADDHAEVAIQDCSGGTYEPSSSTCSNVYCHGNGKSTSTGGTASWTSSSALTCQSCHPNSGLSGKHSKHLGFGYACSTCHPTMSSDGTIADVTRHADCVKDVEGPLTFDPATHSCSSVACHGGTRTW